MRFEVTYSKVDQAISSLGDVKTEMEKCQKKLNSIADSSMFKSGSLKDLNGSISSIQSDVNTEVKECNTLIESLTNIRGIYGSMDNGGNGSGAVEGKNNRKNVANKNNVTMSRVKGNGTLTRTGGGDDDEQEETFIDGFIIVDDMSYIPLSDSLRQTVYDEEDGLNNLHDSAKPENIWERLEMYGTAAFTFAGGAIFEELGLTSGDLLMHYYTGGGRDYIYDGIPLLQNSTVNSIFQGHINDVAMACDGNIADGETVTFANSPSTTWQGCPNFITLENGLPQGLNVAGNFNTLCTLGDAEAGIVCQVTRIGDQYCMVYSYYLVDYYDFDSNLLESMYDMNRYGYGTNFMAYGKISGVATWTAGSDTVINVPAAVPDISPYAGLPLFDLSPWQSAEILPGV